MRPNPVSYADHRLFLRDMFLYCKQLEPAFSYRVFAKRAGFSSGSALKNVIDGKNRIAPGSIPKFVMGLGLTRAEREVFEALVMFCQAESASEKNHYLISLRDKARRIGARPKALEASQYEVYSSVLALPIREMSLLQDFQSCPKWIAKQFLWEVAEEDVVQAVDLLMAVGLMREDPEENWIACETSLSATPEEPSETMLLGIQNYHKNMMKFAAQALESQPKNERNLTSVTVSLGAVEYAYISEKIAELRTLILQLGEHPIDGEGTQRVYNLGFQLVPLTRSISADE